MYYSGLFIFYFMSIEKIYMLYLGNNNKNIYIYIVFMRVLLLFYIRQKTMVHSSTIMWNIFYHVCGVVFGIWLEKGSTVRPQSVVKPWTHLLFFIYVFYRHFSKQNKEVRIKRFRFLYNILLYPNLCH